VSAGNKKRQIETMALPKKGIKQSAVKVQCCRNGLVEYMSEYAFFSQCLHFGMPCMHIMGGCILAFSKDADQE
jgi:hypothetical protein